MTQHLNDRCRKLPENFYYGAIDSLFMEHFPTWLQQVLFAWVGAEEAEVIFLNDSCWSAQIIPWHNLLLGGRLVHHGFTNRTKGYNGDWDKLVDYILTRNEIPVPSFEKLLHKALDKGSGKYHNILITGTTNCRETFILGYLRSFFQPGYNKFFLGWCRESGSYFSE